jgi:hypothetical protein
VKRGETPCLGVCTGGPIVVVYPEGSGMPASRPHCSSESSLNICAMAASSKSGVPSAVDHAMLASASAAIGERWRMN